MKRLILTVLLAFIGFTTFAQNFTAVQLDVMTNKADDAKKELDKKLADPKIGQTAEAYYWKFSVYGFLFKDSAIAAKYPGSDSIALNALYQYAQKDTSIKMVKDNTSGIPALDYLRIVSFNNGIGLFRKSKWEESYVSFKMADDVDAFMLKHGMVKPNYIDTNVVLLTGYAAQNSGKIPEAIACYKALADKQLKVGDSHDFGSNMYTYLLDYYLKNNDPDDFKKYLVTAKALFPEYNANWGQMEMANTTSNSSLQEIIDKYKSDDTKGPMTEQQYIQYADAFAQPDKKDVAKMDSAAQSNLKLTAADVYGKAYNITNGTAANAGVYAFNAGVLYYNTYDELGQRFYNLRGEGADLKTQRDGVEKMQMQYADSSIEWLMNSYNILKAKQTRSRVENSSLNRSVDFLANLYQWKEEKSQGVNPKDVDKYDALYKQFDGEHDKYKNQ